MCLLSGVVLPDGTEADEIDVVRMMGLPLVLLALEPAYEGVLGRAGGGIDVFRFDALILFMKELFLASKPFPPDNSRAGESP